jgi:hypothetical protein
MWVADAVELADGDGVTSAAFAIPADPISMIDPRPAAANAAIFLLFIVPPRQNPDGFTPNRAFN